MKVRIIILLTTLGLTQTACKHLKNDEQVISSVQNEVKSTKFWAHNYNMEMDVSYGDDPAQRVDIYTYGSHIGEPNWFARSKNKKPTLVWIHGGGWRFGNKETDAWFFFHFLERGWNVVNVEHRRGLGTAPDAAEDVLSVMKWISENAEEYRLDTNKIVVSGASSGGHLAMLAGLVNSVPESHPAYVGDKIRIQAIVNWYGITDIQKIEAYLSSQLPNQNFVLNWVQDKEKIPEISKKYSPINYVTENAPPILTIQGDLDTLTPYDQALLLHEKLETVGAKNQLLILEGGTHLGFSEEQFQLIFKTIFDFLKANP
ncbi:alpha/beta hydrolase [Flagellimonas meridianipacifica]|uniref:Acetyl esterase/lipase n=1 Tax=Flagellimonas meridianipacifica TaxID=1080225 RepID=A0A2T0MBN4_9FLAO|nr:alpha/beta hydrolase [Allomuricauda pacifica]PRX54914.1 acetyl esterase/lipase [Allomuricauda pacifica]